VNLATGAKKSIGGEASPAGKRRISAENGFSACALLPIAIARILTVAVTSQTAEGSAGGTV
jgi:hypothetical protein